MSEELYFIDYRLVLMKKSLNNTKLFMFVGL